LGEGVGLIIGSSRHERMWEPLSRGEFFSLIHLRENFNAMIRDWNIFVNVYVVYVQYDMM